MRSRACVQSAATLLLCLSLGACTTDRSQQTDLDAPIFGSSRPTTFVVSPAGGQMRATDLAKVAKILRRYKTLAAAERGLVKSAALKRINGLVETEENLLRRTRYRAERAALAKSPKQPSRRSSLAVLEQKIHQEAVANVMRRLGKLVSVPLKTSDNTSAVAYAKVSSRGDAVEVAAEAGTYEIDHSIASLVDGAPVQGTEGRVAAFLETAPVAIAAGP